jgi:hypothetical protein
VSELSEWFAYPLKSLHIYLYRVFSWINRHVLLTYPSNNDCARCNDCGRTVHDFQVPNSVWLRVIGSSRGVYCYDCFVERAREKKCFWSL